MNLGRLPLERKTGEEPFRDGEREFDLRLVDYWRWSASDLVSNAQRGTLAEFLVAHALGVDGGVEPSGTLSTCGPGVAQRSR